MIKPVIQPKSKYQKDDCLFCEDRSTFEAFCRKGNASANIRCCGKAECQKKAKDLAKKSLEAMS